MLFYQPDWKWCHKCQGLYHGPGTVGVCPADGGAHDATGSGPYVLADTSISSEVPGDPPASSSGEVSWKHCSECHGLFFADAAERRCPAGELHAATPGGDYVIAHDGTVDHSYCPTDYQQAWRRCAFCAGMYFAGNIPPDTPGLRAGACPSVPGGHIAADQHDYWLMGAGPLDIGTSAQLIIVAPPHLLSALRPLVDHKNATGMGTTMVDLSELVPHYEGRDVAEMLKRAITYAFEYLGTRYVLLAGDASVLPVRFRWEHFGPSRDQWRQGVFSPTDLYYANLYRNHAQEPDGGIVHAEWSDWDANRDGLYNYQDFDNNTAVNNPDRVDGYCDVAIGRLPTSEPPEVELYVNKVIAYEIGHMPRAHKSAAVVIDNAYSGWQSCETEIETRVPLSSAVWPDVDRVGYNFTAAAPAANGVRDANGELLSDIVASSSWTVYVGHGSSSGWDIPGSDGASIATMPPTGNVPPVLAVGCATGQLTTFAPDGPSRYIDTAGQPHWYWTLPPGSAAPFQIVDYGPNDPQGGTGVPIHTWQRNLDGSLDSIMPAEPSVFQPDCLTVAREWLFSAANAGAVVYFGEQTVAQNNWGSALVGELLHAAHDGSLGSSVIGDLWTAACRAYWHEFMSSNDAIGNPRIYLSYMTLYGDPSLRTQPFAPP